MHTLQTMYKNEVRAVEITILDQDNVAFEPDTAYVTIYDYDDNVIVAEQEAYVTSNEIYTVVGTTVTEDTGNYKIKWRIVKGDYTYYHLTNLIVLES